MMHGFWQDVRYGWRTVKKSPGFVFVAVLSLALGIGINTAIFSVMHTALERPVSGREPRELVDLSLRTPAGFMNFSFREYDEVRQRTRAFSHVMGLMQAQYRLVGEGQPEMVWGLAATENFFEGFGQQPTLGRGFAPDRSGVGEAVLSHGFWKRRFGGDPGAIGKPLVLYVGGTRLSYTIVGVVPPDFRYATMWTPDLVLPFPEETVLRRGDARALNLMARVKPGMTMGQAQAETEVLAKQLAPLFPDSFGKARLQFSPKVRRDAQTLTVMAIVQAVVGLTLLIACANVMNLLLARHQERRAEMATRLALGASRGRLVRQLLMESLVLALPAGLAGYGIALLTIHVVERLPIPGLAGMRPYFYLDQTVLAYALCAGVAGSLIAGLWPARAASRPDLVPALKGAGAAAGRKFGLRGALVAAQLALSMLGITAAAMLTKGIWDLQPFDRGVDPHKVLAATTVPVMSGYSPGRTAEFRRSLAARLDGLAGVEALAFAAGVPGGGADNNQKVMHTGSPLLPRQETVLVRSNFVGPGFFRTLGIQILRGREYNETDAADRRLCLVNDTMARRFWPGQEPLGQTLRLDGAKGKGYEVVGVARDTAYDRSGNDYTPYLYLPLDAGNYNTLLLRTGGQAGALAETVRRAVAAIDPEMPLLSLDTMADRITGGPGATELRLRAGMMGTLGGTALLLSALGLYGVISYLVSRRTREIGIRLALGAGRVDVLRTVLLEGGRLVAVGMAAGVALSLVVCPLLVSRLHGVQPNRPGVIAAACAILALVAAAAMFVPARRACRVEAMVALRYE
jgi:putative ABC transport system permease protein